MGGGGGGDTPVIAFRRTTCQQLNEPGQTETNSSAGALLPRLRLTSDHYSSPQISGAAFVPNWSRFSLPSHPMHLLRPRVQVPEAPVWARGSSQAQAQAAEPMCSERCAPRAATSWGERYILSKARGFEVIEEGSRGDGSEVTLLAGVMFSERSSPPPLPKAFRFCTARWRAPATPTAARRCAWPTGGKCEARWCWTLPGTCASWSSMTRSSTPASRGPTASLRVGRGTGRLGAWQQELQRLPYLPEAFFRLRAPTL